MRADLSKDKPGAREPQRRGTKASGTTLSELAQRSGERDVVGITQRPPGPLKLIAFASFAASAFTAGATRFVTWWLSISARDALVRSSRAASASTLPSHSTASPSAQPAPGA